MMCAQNLNFAPKFHKKVSVPNCAFLYKNFQTKFS